MASPTVFSQLIKLIPRTQFQEYVTKHNGDARVRSLDCSGHGLGPCYSDK